MKFKDRWEGFTKNISDAAENAKASTKDLLEITRLKNDINDQERFISRLKSQIGQTVWENYQKEDKDYSQTLLHLCGQIQTAQEKINEFSARIDEIKNAAKDGAVETTAVVITETEPEKQPNALCPTCGVPVEQTDRFCRNCGRKLQKQEAQE